MLKKHLSLILSFVIALFLDTAVLPKWNLFGLVPFVMLALMLKLLGVSFAAEFAAQACRDAGEDGIALRVELSAKVMLVILAAPLLRQLASMILELTA